MMPTEKLDDWIKSELFNAAPIVIAVIDQTFNIVRANRAFEEKFGAKWKDDDREFWEKFPFY